MQLIWIVVLTLTLVILIGSIGLAGDRFGDSTATSSRICANFSVVLGKYLTTGNAGVLDSMRVWSRYNDGGSDTLIACIYSPSGILLGRSTDSVIVANDVLNPYLLHFDNLTINISANTRYWIGIQLRASGSSTNSRIASASSVDTLFLGTDILPLESSLPTGAKYLGSGVDAIRITAYYSARNESRTVTRRRRTEFRAESGDDEGRRWNETFVFGTVDCGSSALPVLECEPGDHCDSQ